MWVKIDDGMPHHPKLVSAGAQAFALDVAGICYASRYDLDGFIADGSLAAILPGLSQAKRHAGKLVEVGRWRRDDDRGGYVIHDYEDYQFTAEERAENQQGRSEKSILANHKRWHVRRGMTSPDCPHCIPNASQTHPTGDSSGNPRGIPQHPPTRIDVDLGLVATGLGSGTKPPEPPDGTNGDISPAERHRVGHVIQDKPDPENCDLCARALEAM